MFFVYIRLRKVKLYTFLEFFLDYKNHQLCLPSASVPRFQSRVKTETRIQVNQWGPDFSKGSDDIKLVNGITQYQTLETPIELQVNLVQSEYQGISKRTFNEIQTNGSWVTYNDTFPKGGPLGPYVASFFGLPIDNTVHRILYKWTLRDIYTFVDLNVEQDPTVVYHGTAKENVPSILSNGLKPSFGMLGHAIYYGSFWKAFRFATLTQDYRRRTGGIMRIYAFWNSTYILTKHSGPCTCDSCQKSGLGILLTDHKALWSLFGDSVLAYPFEGGPIKNEEYASLDDSKICIDSIAYAECQTEKHEPFCRNLKIL